MRRLVELTLRPDLTVDEVVAARVLAQLGRRDLRRYLRALRKAVAEASVSVDLEGPDPDTVRTEMSRAFPGRQIVVTSSRGTGGGIRYTAGDDVLDVSVSGYLRTLLQELQKT